MLSATKTATGDLQYRMLNTDFKVSTLDTLKRWYKAANVFTEWFPYTQGTKEGTLTCMTSSDAFEQDVFMEKKLIMTTSMFCPLHDSTGELTPCCSHFLVRKLHDAPKTIANRHLQLVLLAEKLYSLPKEKTFESYHCWYLVEIRDSQLCWLSWPWGTISSRLHHAKIQS